MHVVTKKHLAEAELRYADSARELRSWHAIVRHARWRNFTDVQQTFKDADAVGNYVVFNIRHNRYRLITIIHYSREKAGKITQGHVYVRSFLTHKEYDNKTNWDKGVKR